MTLCRYRLEGLKPSSTDKVPFDPTEIDYPSRRFSGENL